MYIADANFASLLLISQFISINNLTSISFDLVRCRRDVKWKLNDSKATNRMHNLFLGRNALSSFCVTCIYVSHRAKDLFSAFRREPLPLTLPLEWLPFSEYFALFWNAPVHSIIYHCKLIMRVFTVRYL